MGKLTGKYAIITGAGKGIGAGVAKVFVQEDVAGLAIVDMDIELAQKTAKELDPTGTRVFAFQCNVANYEQVEKVFAEIEAQFGRIDALVNSAGINRDKTLIKMTEEEWKAVINVDLSAIFYCCKAVAPGMVARKYGKMVNISSIGFKGNLGQINYATAKYGVVGLSRGLAKDLAQYNITVNTVCPATVATDMIKSVKPELLAQKVAMFPRKRPAEPEEIGTVCLFLCSDDSSFVNGEKMIVTDARICD